jgi:predicted DNA-binding transcriptional regulator YafY
VSYRQHLSRNLSGLFDASHYLALRLAMGQGGPARRLSAIFASLEDLSDKIEKALGPAARERLTAIDACFLSYEKFAYEKTPPDVFWPLVSAIAGRWLCRVRYRAPRVPIRTKTFDVLPLRLFVHGGAVYLLCGVPKHASVATLNLQRLVDITVLERHGEPPADFDIARWEASAFGVYSGCPTTTYRLRFAADAAPYVRERVWHTSQKLHEVGDGRVDLEFTCGDSYEIDSWVASWRTRVEVLAPRRLRADLARLGAWLSEKYREPLVAAARPGRARSVTRAG